MSSLKSYFSLVKFSHTIFALPFALIGFFLALQASRHPFDSFLFLKVLLCMVLARTAAMAFNRYADRGIDSENERTRNREIPAGVVSQNAALFLVIACCLLFMLTTWFINRLCFYLSPVVLLIILGYSLTKRFTFLCHLVLGLELEGEERRFLLFAPDGLRQLFGAGAGVDAFQERQIGVDHGTQADVVWQIQRVVRVQYRDHP